MKYIFVNLKRFDVPREMGGLCVWAYPPDWIRDVLTQCLSLGLGCIGNLKLVFLLPESLLAPALEYLAQQPRAASENLEIGVQGAHRLDVSPGGNFGALTTFRPAAAMKALRCQWVMIGHSEERGELGVTAERLARKHFKDNKESEGQFQCSAKHVINSILGEEAGCVLARDLNLLFCVGETADEKGEGPVETQRRRVTEVLSTQLEQGLGSLLRRIGREPWNESEGSLEICIGYEPVWAIGPGKTPADSGHIRFTTSFIRRLCSERWGIPMRVVYGGGLKEENAAALAAIEDIDGGLVALTRFNGEIGFYPEDLAAIIRKYMSPQHCKHHLVSPEVRG